jgi:hypothetical protein
MQFSLRRQTRSSRIVIGVEVLIVAFDTSHGQCGNLAVTRRISLRSRASVSLRGQRGWPPFVIPASSGTAWLPAADICRYDHRLFPEIRGVHGSRRVLERRVRHPAATRYVQSIA